MCVILTITSRNYGDCMFKVALPAKPHGLFRLHEVFLPSLFPVTPSSSWIWAFHACEAKHLKSRGARVQRMLLAVWGGGGVVFDSGTQRSEPSAFAACASVRLHTSTKNPRKQSKKRKAPFLTFAGHSLPFPPENQRCLTSDRYQIDADDT